MDLVVRGRVLDRDGSCVRASVGIEKGTIVEIGGASLTGREILDVGERVILPARVDPHVHFREPGAEWKEDFSTGSLSALFGGVTAVLDMPNTDPPTETEEALEIKRRRAHRRSYIDYGFFIGVPPSGSSAPWNRGHGVKVYMAETTGRKNPPSDGMIRHALQQAARTGRVVAFHAEDEECRRVHRERVQDRSDFAAHEESRPAECEKRAIERIAKLHAGTGAEVHICHISSAEGLGALPREFTAEVTLHHLLLSKKDLEREGALLKTNPPLRSAQDLQALWNALLAGRVFLASDHAPHTLEEKRRGGVFEAPAGVPGVETLFPILLEESRKGRIPLPTLVRQACEAPSSRYKIPKGRIALGFDADLVVVDFSKRRKIRGSELHSRCGWTPFEGWEGIFPTHVILRGEVVLEGEEIVGPPRGREIPLPGGRGNGE